MKRLPVTNLFEEYRSDFRWMKTFYLPSEMTSIDIIFASALSPIQKEVFQEEETRLFNLLAKLKADEPKKYIEGVEEVMKFSKLDYKSFVFCHSMDFFLFPDKTRVFRQKLHKFFDLIKAWTKSENIYVDMDAMRKYLANEEIFSRLRSRVTKEFKMATKFQENPVNKLKAFENNLTYFHENHSQAFPSKLTFVSKTLNLDNDVFLMDSVLSFVVARGIEQMDKKDQDCMREFLNKDLVSGMVNLVTKTWGKIRHFHSSLNNGEFAGEGLGVSDETEFYNLHKLLPLVYGPTSLNHKHFRKFLYHFFIQRSKASQDEVVPKQSSVQILGSVHRHSHKQHRGLQLRGKGAQVPQVQTERETLLAV